MKKFIGFIFIGIGVSWAIHLTNDMSDIMCNASIAECTISSLVAYSPSVICFFLSFFLLREKKNETN